MTGGSAQSALVSAALPGAAITYVTGAAISSVNFNNFRVLYVPSNTANTTGGITNADIGLLAARKLDVRDFINAGGGIFALTESDATAPYSWLEIPNPFSIQNFTSGGTGDPNTLRQTPAALAAGLTISDIEISAGIPYHNAFNGPVGFNNLLPFVIDRGPNLVYDGLPIRPAEAVVGQGG